MKMEDINREPMVTIPLRDYNELRDRADIGKIMVDRLTNFEFRFSDLSIRVNNLEDRRRLE